MDYTLGEMETLQLANEQKVTEIQRLNNQLNKALDVNLYHTLIFIYSFILKIFRQSNEQLI